jgi:hypothetical protein
MMHQLQDLSHRHQAIIDWLILNPDKGLGDCAAHFNYTKVWLSNIVHSDMFQAAYQEQCKARHALAVHTLVNEMGGLTALAIDKTREKLEGGQASERFLGDTLRTSLAALGYGAGNGNGNGNGHSTINVQVNAPTIIAAREKAARLLEGTTEAKLPVGECLPIPRPPVVEALTELDVLMEEGT